ncbi:D-alanine--D-alanine ligase A [Candidatus Amesbacteria bacterium RIFCSPHIGHO2_01_FULL_48_32]|uniref:D-alanine--D-alanine ligase n=1 Tax=Candidatus Amesbacteria bacterium RIFCSPLOWO2_01_FULL_48_25 TaxID=1797259 RepID=A0A1F4ZDI3_9BACT|nr:MAG: D-alanine--D-alanine ligase A [Candidatus Amesbacteria bacterium RIFCSPHIGHO2_01_FULL_48_32]OGD04312.1 MAG: D-alanine--D-alanine ligase A [Candidatus Amesbacteria bacterium RIFCSPLOWO2_01_FULL_48_25]HJZ05513.1 D-alanine--D-alanine ligase family protein [Patescibacteria group bacterium]
MGKIRVGVVFGGRSGEHEVSVRSAASIYRALDKNKYEVSLLGVDKNGRWHRMDQKWLPSGSEMKSLPSGDKSLVPQDEKLDVVFPIIHGTYGEDGSLQGLLELMDVAYVGAGVLGSAVGMDKDVQKRLLMQSGIPVAKFEVVKDIELIKRLMLKYPVFVKPVNMGSSVGVSKAASQKSLVVSLKQAFKYDTKAIIEEEVKGRELEVSVLGNDDPIASIPGEVIAKRHEFYDYEAKYIDENGAELKIPARLTKEQVSEIQKLAIRAFKVLECGGMARVDMFMRPDGQLVINEINTLPGFTSISMYPKLWEASGLSYSKLLDRLIELAIEKKKQKDRLKRSYE